MYSMMTVLELKEELKKRKASVTGKKAALIQRLEAYDRNHNFGIVDVNIDEIYVTPGIEKFRDINASTKLPPLTKQHIQAFIDRFQIKPKGRQMYESRFLLTSRVAVEGDFFYIQGQCRAQMKKLVYIVNVKLNKHGCIDESHCECAAGSGLGAHCKHVLVLLYGVEDMVRTKSIILHQVCTQELMTFKRPRKAFYDSPIQAEHIPNKRRKIVDYSPLEEDDIIENYEDYVRNLCLSFGVSTMPILQLYRPANPYAIELDHDYLSQSLRDWVLENFFLKNVSTTQVADIEASTRQQDKNKEWFLYRAQRITASNFHSVCHSKQNTRHNLAEKIINPKPFHSKSTAHGKVQEPVAIQKYCEMYDLHVQPCGLFISITHPFLGASPDGLLGEETLIEVKCPYVARHSIINHVTVPYLEIVHNKFSLKENHPYYYQIQGQLFCSNKNYCNLIIYTFVDMKVIFVQRNESFINDMLIKPQQFYNEYFEKAILDKLFYKYYDQLKP